MSKRILVVEDQEDNRQSRSRSSRSPPMRLVGKNRKRGRLAVMNMYRNHTARANCWQKSVSTCSEAI